MFAQAMGISGLLTAFMAPFGGALADKSGRLRGLLTLSSLICILCCAGLWFATPQKSSAPLALILTVTGVAFFELSQVFYNGLLHRIAPPNRIGTISGLGWGLGYLGGLVCLALCLFGLIGLPGMPAWLSFPTGNGLSVRLSCLLAAAWFLLFAVPLFLLAPDSGDKIPLRDAITSGITALKGSITLARSDKTLFRFLIASALYRDGLTTLFTVGGVFASGVFGLSAGEVLIFAIGLNVTAGIGAFIAAPLDDKIGAKKTILIALTGLILTGTAILFLNDKTHFIALSLVLGLFVGPAQAASRSLLTRLAPENQETGLFGLYALTGKAASFIGPFSFAALTSLFHAQRAGLIAILALWMIGGLILLRLHPVSGHHSGN